MTTEGQSVDDLRVRVNDSDIDAARASAEDEGLTVQEAAEPTDELAADIEPITMLLLGGGALAAARFVSGWIDKRRGGLVLDLREGAKDDRYRDADVPWGFIVIYPADGGEVKIEVKDEPKDAIERLITEVISGGFKTVTDLAKAAKEAVSQSGKVTTGETGAAT